MTTSSMATPGRSPTTRARCDDNELLPTPKKLKTESPVEPAPRRPALRDVTNELKRVTSAGRSTDAKKKSSSVRKTQKRRAAVNIQVAELFTSENDGPSDSPEAPEVETPAENQYHKAQPEAVEPAAIAPPSPCAPQDELLAFDPLMGQSEQEELAEILYTRLRETQMRHRVCLDYFEDQLQPHVNAKMRSILVDWLIEVHFRLQLSAETLFLAINYLDRFLTEAVTTRSELQLVGLTCLFIAAKYEEVEPADLTDMSYVTKNTYSGDQIIAMERKIIRVLGFNLSAVTAEAFAGYFTQKLHLDPTASMLAAFFTQSMLLHLPLLVCYPPADRAAAAVFLAQCATADERPSDEWTSKWETIASSSLEDLLPCLYDLCTILAHPSKRLAALRTKFGTKRFGRVATHPVDDLKRFL